jgi:hypothetical protein
VSKDKVKIGNSRFIPAAPGPTARRTSLGKSEEYTVLKAVGFAGRSFWLNVPNPLVRLTEKSQSRRRRKPGKNVFWLTQDLILEFVSLSSLLSRPASKNPFPERTEVMTSGLVFRNWL